MTATNFSDWLAISNLLARYCDLFDSGDYEGYSQLFSHGRIVGPDGAVREGAVAVLHHQQHSTLYEDGTPRTSHVNSNLHIEVADDRMTATARSYVTVFQALEDFRFSRLLAGGIWILFTKSMELGIFVSDGLLFLCGETSVNISGYDYTCCCILEVSYN
ncbi:hypothetical protein K432DRAFT_410391 [Lepidopterella palustris CBS 459.81]|uniref:SnoaL-like domain-containing protein n=1 Tax=Lepidopterella palustris CBS 459.81 TaxID=1314670 RepID=A0A8E2DY72_9PEZI|nr:hypothetical protein K432DRAFT_410391 [Lepidopterella palustris CBS 459.81]